MSELLFGTTKFAVPLNEFADTQKILELAFNAPIALDKIKKIVDIRFDGDIPKVEL